MFEYLSKINFRLYERYLTVERNIKSASNSFYDSYLDMQEQFIKDVLVSENIECKVNETCGAILKREDVKELFTKIICLNEYTFNKMQDYTLKVNAHKHKGEKKIAVDTIVNYLTVFHTATAAYCNKKNIESSEYDANETIRIFGIYEKENIALKDEVNALRDELYESVVQGKMKDNDIASFRSLLSKTEIDKLSLEEQNEELNRQIIKLKDIKLNSMEEKLNRTIDLLLELKPAIVENRVITKAVGNGVGALINGRSDNVDVWLEETRKKEGNN